MTEVFEGTQKNRQRVVACCWLIFLLNVLLVQEVRGGPATPPSLQDIFIGRCYEYQEVIYPEPFITSPKNCSYLWELFVGAFAYQNDCEIPLSNYYDFTTAADHYIDTSNKVMYWSGSVIPLAYEYVADMRRYVTVRDTLSGYIFQNIDTWCGQPGSPGFNSTDCPPYGSCVNQSAPSYWRAVSTMFAEKVEGFIHVLLNGSNGSAFRVTSTFAQNELENLDAVRNPILYVWLIHNIDGSNTVRESCTNGTLLELRSRVLAKNMTYMCEEDPTELTYFQCVDNVNAAACKQLGSNSAHQKAITPELFFLFALMTLTPCLRLFN